LARQEDQPAVIAASREPLGRERSEVLDVVRDHGSELRGRGLEDRPVVATVQLVAPGDRDDVVATRAQQQPRTR
jgi:hypothetical protein